MIETIVTLKTQNNKVIEYESFYSPHGYNSLDALEEHYKELTFVKAWTIKEKKTKKVILSSRIVNAKAKEEKARSKAKVKDIKAKKKVAKKISKKRTRKPFSEEHKRKIAEALRKRHAEKRGK